MPIHVSNVSLLEGDKAVRAGYVFEGEGDKRKRFASHDLVVRNYNRMETTKTRISTAFKALQSDFGYTNVMQSPKVEKVVISVGVGRSR